MTWRALIGLVFLAVLAGCNGPTAALAPAAGATGPMPRFEDVTERAGIRFQHQTGADGRFLMPESVGPGGALFDYDGDGWLDVFLVNGANWPDRPPSKTTCALFRNQKDGTFKETTREAGLAVSVYGMGCAVGDFDNDGHPDLVITCLGPNRLFRNQGDGTFRDVTATSGLGGGPRWGWHTSAAWTDYDRDGLLDLFICRYVKWTPETDVVCKSGSGKRTYCGPQQYPGDTNLLYRNLGGGRFRDVSAATGISRFTGKGLGVVPLDENGDGWVDLFVTNDLRPNFLFRNEGEKRFVEVGEEAGVAVGESGQPRAGMGTDAADVRNDGGLQFAVGNFSGEGLALFDRGSALYTDVAPRHGLVPASLSRLTFGLTFLDADRDGWQDLFVYNGHVDPQVAEMGAGVEFREPPQLYRNEQGVFRDASAEAGAPFQDAQVGRGCASGDFDNDGRPDLLLCDNGGPTRLLRNVTPDQRHWLGVVLKGSKSNRSGYGAEARLTAGGVTQRRWVRSGSSYLSHGDTRALFGLGEAAEVERLEVRWPSGKVTVKERPEVGRYMEISE